MSNIGGRVRTARKAAGLSQEGLARLADVSLNVVSRLERGGIADPHVSTLGRIADGLGVSVGELLDSPKVEAPTSSTSVKEADEERRNWELAKELYWMEPIHGTRANREEGVSRAYPYPWMAGTLAETIARWSKSSLEGNDPKYSHIIAVACFDFLESVLKYDAPGATLKDRVPENELEGRLKLVDWLDEVARRAQDH